MEAYYDEIPRRYVRFGLDACRVRFGREAAHFRARKTRLRPPEATAASSSTYTVVNLGTLGGAVSGANSINNHDWASGVSSLSSSSYVHAALWKNGAPAIDLGTLGRPEQRRRVARQERPRRNFREFPKFRRQSAARRNLVVRGSLFSSAPERSYLPRLRVAKRAMIKLPTLGGNNGFAAGANESGTIVGWAETRKHDPTCTSPQVLGFEAVVYEACS